MSRIGEYVAYMRPRSIPVTLVMAMTGWLASPSRATPAADVVFLLVVYSGLLWGGTNAFNSAEDRDTGPFFATAREGRLVYAACGHCGRASHPPTPFCSHCRRPRSEWREASGRGILHSFTVVAHQIHPDYPTPYTIVLVTLADSADVRLVGRIDGDPPLVIGQPMELWFETLADDVVLPQWRPAAA